MFCGSCPAIAQIGSVGTEVGVGFGVGVGVGKGVGVGIGVGVGVGAGAGVAVGVGNGVRVGTGVGVSGVSVGVGAMAVGVGVAVGGGFHTTVGPAVGVAAGLTQANSSIAARETIRGHWRDACMKAQRMMLEYSQRRNAGQVSLGIPQALLTSRLAAVLVGS